MQGSGNGALFFCFHGVTMHVEPVAEPVLLFIHAGARHGHTRRLLAAAVRGARRVRPRPALRVRHSLSAGPLDLLAARVTLFATPEKFGYMAGALKDLFDRSYYPLEGRVEGRPYALIVAAGSDGRGAVQAVQRIVRGLALKPVAEPLRVVGPPSEDDLRQARELGEALAAGLALGIF